MALNDNDKLLQQSIFEREITDDEEEKLDIQGVSFCGTIVIDSEAYELYKRRVNDVRVCKVCHVELPLKYFRGYGKKSRNTRLLCTDCERVRHRNTARLIAQKKPKEPEKKE